MNRKRMIAALVLAILLIPSIPSITAAQAPMVQVDPYVWQALRNGGSADILVVLKEQADIEGARELRTKTEKGHYVYERLTEVAKRTQPTLQAYLDSQGLPYRSYWIQNMIRVQATAAVQVENLARRPEVAKIDYLYPAYPEPVEASSETTAVAQAPQPDTIEWNILRVNADDVWSMLNVTGTGAVVGDLDTGVQYNHPALVGQYRGNLGGGVFDHNYNWYDPGGSLTPLDYDTHGTHTMGTIVGSDDPTHPLSATNGIGMAPGARWIACPGIGSPTTTPVDCFQWFLAPTNLTGTNPLPDLAPHVINNSWTSATDYRAIIHTLYLAGIYYAKSAGNTGSGCGTVTNPGQWPEVTATAAFAQGDTIASFSSRGPVTVDRQVVVKPDIAAPGVNVRSSVPGNGYAPNQGTSMACPHTTGAVALIISARPDLAGQIDTIQHLLKSTADPKVSAQCPPYVDVPNDVWGWGILNIYAAVQAAQATNIGYLVGTVTDATTTAPLSGARLRVQDTVDGWTWIPRFSNATGEYSFTLPAGTYSITASLYGYLPHTATLTIATGTTLTHDIALAIAPIWTISGTITEAGTGYPLPARVAFEGSPISTRADSATGYYSADIAEGNYWTIVRMPGHTTVEQFIPIHSDLTRDFVLTPIYNYYLRTNELGCGPTFGWIDAVGTGTPHNLGDDANTFLTFSGHPSFTFFGNSYNGLYIGSNGILTFGTGSSTFPGTIPNPALPNNGIYAFPTDLNPANGAQGVIYHLWVGDVLVIEYYQVQHYPSGDPETFEFVLDFAARTVWIQYLVVSNPTDVFAGVENSTGAEATGYFAPLHANLALAFYPWFSTPPSDQGAGTLEGTVVVSGTAAPIPGATVDVVGFTPPYPPFSATTDLSGTYSIADLCVDFYTATASAPGYSPSDPVVVTIFSGSVTMQDFALSPACDAVHDAAFTWDPPTPHPGQVVTFDGSAQGSPEITYAWDFGDDGTGSGASITHTYDVAGDYTVIMTATNDCGQQVIQHAVSVTTTCEPVYDASFTQDLPHPVVDETITFSGTASGDGPISYAWSFGDTMTGTGPVVTHAYTATGSYLVTMVATGACGTDEYSATVTVGLAPVAGFAALSPVCLDTETVFTNTTEGTVPISYLWAFGDDATSTATNPLHTYAQPGHYTVTLTAQSDYGTSQASTVVEVLPLPAAAFTYTVNGLVATFSNTSVGATSYLWMFGDDITSTETNPIHTYGAAGPYTVTLQISGPCGTHETSRAIVLVAPEYKVYLPVVTKGTTR